MKNVIIFLAGAVVGAIIVLIIGIIIAKSEIVSNLADLYKDEIVMFDEPGDCINEQQSFKVSQVIDSGIALAKECSSDYGSTKFYNGLEVLFIIKGKEFYNDQIINIPKGKCVRHIGIYKYLTNTYPVVEIGPK